VCTDVLPGKNADVACGRENMRRHLAHGLLSWLFYDIDLVSEKAESDATVIVSINYKPRTVPYIPYQPVRIRS